MSKKFTTLFLGDVVKTVGSRVFRKLTTDSGGLPVWDGTDLTGTTWHIPAGWNATAGYGANYNVLYSVNGRTDNPNYLYLDIGYEGEFDAVDFYFNTTQKANTVCVNNEGPPYTNLSNTTAFDLYFQDENAGADATNTSLISWLKANGELISHQMPTPSLKDTAWNVPKNWSSVAGCGQFDVNGTVTYSLFNNRSFDGFAIGYTNALEPQDNYCTVNIDGSWTGIFPNLTFTITFNGGTDLTNTDLIAWLNQYGTQQ